MDQTLPRLPRPRRRELIRLGRKTKDPQTNLRFLMIAKLSAGQNKSEVARALEVAISTVVRTVQKYLCLGIEGLLDLRMNNGPRKITDIFLDGLRRVLRGSPSDWGYERPTWTRELLSLVMHEQGFPKVAPCTLGRALRAIGARLGRPKPSVRCPWPKKKREQQLRRLRRLAAAASAFEPVLYADEIDIHLNPKIGADWMLPGQQRQVITPGQNRKHYLAGALDARTGSLYYVDGARKTCDLFCDLLRHLARVFPLSRHIHLIVDNYSIHTAKKTQRCLQELGGRVVLHFLPPYCPDHNRIERLWQDLHGNVTRNHRCSSMDELLRRVYSFLLAYDDRRWLNPSLRRDPLSADRHTFHESRSVI
jgi:transposase